MRISIILVLFFNLYASDLVMQPCYVTVDNHIECGEEPTKKVLPLYLTKGANYLFMQDNQLPKLSLAIVVRTPLGVQGPGWEEYFILDYKNMEVYDKECLGGNYAFVKREVVYYYKWGSGNKLEFKKENFKHCKQPLKKWLEKPYKPYD